MVLGAASWLGYLLVDQLASIPRYRVFGSLHIQQPNLPASVTFFRAGRSREYIKALEQYQPEVIVNFLRGEDSEGAAINDAVINYCSVNNGHYVYASSALALDGYEDILLSEDLLGKSKSIYGRFKAACEAAILKGNITCSIIRFSSVQGWVPHKVTRTESFLRKMRAGEAVQVDRGVVQNRMVADLLVEAIEEIIHSTAEGVFHFGTTDASEEYHFLRNLAITFGYDSDRVIAGSQKDINISLLPGKNVKQLAGKFCQTEADTLSYLRNLSALSAYHEKRDE